MGFAGRCAACMALPVLAAGVWGGDGTLPVRPLEPPPPALEASPQAQAPQPGPAASAGPAVTNPAVAAGGLAVMNLPAPACSPSRGQQWTSPATGMEFVWVEALGVWVGKYEVTNGEYRRMDPDHYSDVFQGRSLNGNRQPVVYVSFYGARAFAEWMTRSDRASGHLTTNMHYRLPVEAEWMAFAQCGGSRKYPWGDDMPPTYGNYSDASAKASFPRWTAVAGYEDGSAVSCEVENSGRNDWGLYGVGGNVWEPVARDASGRFFATWHGASWRYDNADFLSCDYASARDGASCESDFGFRLVMVDDGGRSRTTP